MTQTVAFDFLLFMLHFYADVLNDHCSRITVITIFIAGSFLQAFPLSLYSLTSDLLRSVPPPAFLSLHNDQYEFLEFLCLLYTLILMEVWKMLFCFRVFICSIIETSACSMLDVERKCQYSSSWMLVWTSASVSFEANLCVLFAACRIRWDEAALLRVTACIFCFRWTRETEHPASFGWRSRWRVCGVFLWQPTASKPTTFIQKMQSRLCSFQATAELKAVQ